MLSMDLYMPSNCAIWMLIDFAMHCFYITYMAWLELMSNNSWTLDRGFVRQSVDWSIGLTCWILSFWCRPRSRTKWMSIKMCFICVIYIYQISGKISGMRLSQRMEGVEKDDPRLVEVLISPNQFKKLKPTQQNWII